MIKFQNHFFIEILTNNVTNSGHQNNAHMHTGLLQNLLNDELVFSLFERETKSRHKGSEEKRYYATQYQHIIVQYDKGFFCNQKVLTSTLRRN